jgi:chorismate mutase/prephenate dehydratase
MGGIAYLGPEGTFSGILARQRFGAKAPLVPCPAIDGVFEAVLSGKAEFGIVPVENSSGGAVHDTIDLLIRHAGGVSILEETSLDIRIALLGHRGQPIRRIFSHFTQLRHHADWLLKNHPEARHTAVESTTTAAAQAARKKDAAALASPGAAKIYGLDILRPRVRKAFPKSARDETIPLCRPCHKQVHALLTEPQLARDFNTPEKLASHPDLARFIEWISRQPPTADIPVRKTRRK